MIIADTDVMRIYSALLDGDDGNGAELLSEYIDKETQPLIAKSGEPICDVKYDPWDENEPPFLHACTLRKGHDKTDTRIHADYKSGICEMWWTKP